MDISQLIAVYNKDQRKEVEYPDMRREVTSHVVRHIDTSGNRQGFVIYSDLDDSNVEQVIREQVRFFEDIAQDFEWKLFDYDQPPDLQERLASHGFTVEAEEAIMVLDLEDAPAVLWQPAPHPVERISEPDQLADVVSVQRQVWNEDFSGLGTYLGETLRRYPEQMSRYVAYSEGQPVSAAWTYFPQHSLFASLWGGSTVQGFRGQGFYTTLLAVRAQEAKARGVSYLTVDASDMSRPILEKFGFVRIGYSYPCKWAAKSKGQS